MLKDDIYVITSPFHERLSLLKGGDGAELL